MSSECVAVVGVPLWASSPAVGDALSAAGMDDVVVVQRRSDGRVLVAVLPLASLAAPVRELLKQREPIPSGMPHRWLLALDADGTAAVADAFGQRGERASA